MAVRTDATRESEQVGENNARVWPRTADREPQTLDTRKTPNY